jgi:polysaccharide biosynthesis transport protein
MLVQTLTSPSRESLPVLRQGVEENELKRYARLVWRWLWLILICTLLAGAGAYVVSRLSTPIYQASATLLISGSAANASYQDILTNERLSRTYAELMLLPSLREEVAGNLGLPLTVFDKDITSIRVTSVANTQLLRITVEGSSPQLVTAIANMLPQVFIQRNQEVQSARYAASKKNLQDELQQLSAEIGEIQAAIEGAGAPQSSQERADLERQRDLLAQSKSSYATLLSRFEELRLVEAQSIDSISISEPARQPDKPVRPRPLTNTLLAAVVGAMLALGIIFLIEYLDDRIRSPEELSRVLDTAWMGAIARLPEAREGEWSPLQLIAQNEPRHPISESFRRVRTNLQFSQVDRGLRSLLVTSASPGEGKSLNAANLAIVMAQAGRSVLLIDGDLRRPVQHKLFDLPMSPGLTDALLQGDEDALDFSWESGTPNLRLMPCGKRAPNPAELVGSERMARLLAQLDGRVEMLIIDAPPVLAVADAQILGRQTQGVLLVVDAERTRRTAAMHAADALRQVGANLLGAVVNRLSRSSQGYDDYSYQYDYYRDETPSEESYADPSRRHRMNGAGRHRQRVESAG